MSDTTNYLLENMKSYASPAAQEIAQVKAGAGRMFRLTVVNANAATRFLYVFDNATADSGTLLCPPVSIATGGSFDIAWQYGHKFANGFRVHSSTSQATFTASGAADFIVTADFI